MVLNIYDKISKDNINSYNDEYEANNFFQIENKKIKIYKIRQLILLFIQKYNQKYYENTKNNVYDVGRFIFVSGIVGTVAYGIYKLIKK